MKFSELKETSVSIEEKILKLSVLIIDSLNSVEKLKILMHDRTIEGCKVIELLSFENITELLEKTSMDALITSYWNGN